ncbi:LysR family transcriptional regulator [Lysobacteraceae bacterium NML120232]|nr:LysR family transcriptional regulator [Xanthomonadaceae bacterium NML08-0793]PJK13361.1 LysR family transcriptional regulator [Xanthomonadaceae bacterium NML120232]
MQDLNDLHYFALVVDHGGYAAAERALGIPRSRLSRRIAQLEEALGVRLLQRSTRSFAVTEVGQNVYRHALAMREAAQAAQDAVAQLSATPRGVVRVSVPVTLAQEVMPEVLPAFLDKYPDVRLHAHVSNRRVDLIQEGFDVALRVRSKLDDDGSLVLRSFGHDQQLLVASPDYLRKHGRPRKPEDLGTHVTLSMFEDEARQQWELHGPDGEVRTVELKPRLAAFDFQMLRAMVKQGIGITMLPEMSCAEAVKNGELEVILPEWKLPQGIIHAVFPSRRGMLPAVRAFIDHLAETLPQKLGKKRCSDACTEHGSL